MSAEAGGRALPARVAVTGGAGFIGSHTVERLVDAGCAVLVIDDLSHACGASLPAEVEVLVADCGSEEAAGALRRFRPDALLHLAARGGVARVLRDPAGHLRSAVASSIAVYAAAAAAGARAILSASSGGALYGDSARLPYAESLRPAPRSPYGASKAAEEVYLGCFARLHGVRGLALRYGNVYGPRQDGTGEAGVVAITCLRLLDGRSPVVYGDGLQTRDFVYVADIADANLAALTAARGGAVNLGTGRETAVRHVVEHLVSLHTGPAAVRSEPARGGEARRVALATARARSWLGWEARVSVEDGLRRTLAAFAGAGPRRLVIGA